MAVLNKAKRFLSLVLNTLRTRNGVLIGRKVKIVSLGSIRGGRGSTIGGYKNKTTTIFGNPKSVLYNLGQITLGNNCRVHIGAKLYNEGEINIGNNTYINPGSLIIIKNKLTIGSGCAISWGVTIMDDDLHSITNKSEDKGEIIISDNVWVGADCKVLKNVCIGEGAVIAAGSIVTKNIPANCLAAGIPARMIKEDIKWE